MWSEGTETAISCGISRVYARKKALGEFFVNAPRGRNYLQKFFRTAPSVHKKRLKSPAPTGAFTRRKGALPRPDTQCGRECRDSDASSFGRVKTEIKCFISRPVILKPTVCGCALASACKAVVSPREFSAGRQKAYVENTCRTRQSDRCDIRACGQIFRVKVSEFESTVSQTPLY